MKIMVSCSMSTDTHTVTNYIFQHLVGCLDKMIFFHPVDLCGT